MAKAQKTVMVSDELMRLFASREKKGGATFARQASAAMLDYFFDRVSGPDPIWIEAVVAIENGELLVADAGAFVARKRSERAKLLATSELRLRGKGCSSGLVDADAMQAESAHYELESYRWDHGTTWGKQEPIEALDEMFKHHYRKIDDVLDTPRQEDQTAAKNK